MTVHFYTSLPFANSGVLKTCTLRLSYRYLVGRSRNTTKIAPEVRGDLPRNPSKQHPQRTPELGARAPKVSKRYFSLPRYLITKKLSIVVYVDWNTDVCLRQRLFFMFFLYVKFYKIRKSHQNFTYFLKKVQVKTSDRGAKIPTPLCEK